MQVALVKEGQTLKYQLGVKNSLSVKSLRHTPNSKKIRELNLQINDSQSVVCTPLGALQPIGWVSGSKLFA